MRTLLPILDNVYLLSLHRVSALLVLPQMGFILTILLPGIPGIPCEVNLGCQASLSVFAHISAGLKASWFSYLC